MKITILGSGGVTGLPVWSCNCKTCNGSTRDKKDIRTRSSILVESGNKKILIDMGHDFRNQMLKYRIKRLDTVLITPTHSDHISSLSQLRDGGNVRLEIPGSVYDKIERKTDKIKYLRKRNSEMKIVKFKPHKIGNVFVDSIEVNHNTDFTKDKEPCFGFLFEENGFRFAYIPDFMEILESDKLKDLDLFICDGTTMESEWGHAGIENGLKIYNKIKPKRMLFTHIGHYQLSHKELEEYVKKFGNIGIAYDGMVIGS